MQRIEALRGRETILYETIMMDAGHYTCVQTPRMHNTKNEPCCKPRTVGDGARCRFANHNTQTPLVGNDGKGEPASRRRGHEGSLYFQLSLTVDLKLLQKSSF